jgi:hypothetical protein
MTNTIDIYFMRIVSTQENGGEDDVKDGKRQDWISSIKSSTDICRPLLSAFDL